MREEEGGSKMYSTKYLFGQQKIQVKNETKIMTRTLEREVRRGYIMNGL